MVRPWNYLSDAILNVPLFACLFFCASIYWCSVCMCVYVSVCTVHVSPSLCLYSFGHCIYFLSSSILSWSSYFRVYRSYGCVWVYLRARVRFFRSVCLAARLRITLVVCVCVCDSVIQYVYSCLSAYRFGCSCICLCVCVCGCGCLSICHSEPSIDSVITLRDEKRQLRKRTILSQEREKRRLREAAPPPNHPVTVAFI